MTSGATRERGADVELRVHPGGHQLAGDHLGAMSGFVRQSARNAG